MSDLARAAAALDDLASLGPGPETARAVQERLGTFLRLVRSDADPAASAKVTSDDLAYLVSTAEGAQWMAETVLDLYADDRVAPDAPIRQAGPADDVFEPRPVPTKAAALDEMWDSITLDLGTVRALAGRLTQPPDRPRPDAGGVVDLAGHEDRARDHHAALRAARALLDGPPPAFGRGRTARAQAAAWDLAMDQMRDALAPLLDGQPPRTAAGRDWLPGKS